MENMIISTTIQLQQKMNKGVVLKTFIVVSVVVLILSLLSFSRTNMLYFDYERIARKVGLVNLSLNIKDGSFPVDEESKKANVEASYIMASGKEKGYAEALINYKRLTSMSIRAISNDFSQFDCDEIAGENAPEQIVKKAVEWKYPFDKEREIIRLLDSSKEERCEYIKTTFGFSEMPLSKEEADYPLAYGALAYKWTEELYYMISALYHPQNLYCIAIDQGAPKAFSLAIHALGSCFPNIFVINVGKVRYMGFEVIKFVHDCLRTLVEQDHDWKYFQYLSNFDLPLKTNREMVRIFKQLNGSFNAEVTDFQPHRLAGKINETIPYNITLFKSSLSATFSRASANFLATDERALKVLDFLNGTVCPDESFWVSVAGNPKLGMPYSFNATAWLKARKINKGEVIKGAKTTYYLSRYQLWYSKSQCKGEIISGSCAFGVGDLPKLLTLPHLIAHKFYLDLQPAAFFCLYKKIRDRALEPIEKFDDSPYGELPCSRETRGEKIENFSL